MFAAVVLIIGMPMDAGKVSFTNDIRPILAQHCQGCHQPAKAQGDYVVTDVESLVKAGESGKAAIVPGRPDASHILEQVHVEKGKAAMPKNREPLTEKQIELIRRWIATGAEDDTPTIAKSPLIDADHPPVYRSLPVVTSLAWSPDGKHLAISGYHEVLLYDADFKLIGRLVGLSERVQSLAFSPDGKWLAVAGGSPGRFGEVQLWNPEKQRLKYSVSLTFDTLYGISWSPDGRVIAFGATDNTVRGIQADTGTPILMMGTHSDWVLGTAFSQDGLHLASVSRDMSLKLTEVAEQRFVDNITTITPGQLKGGLMAIDRRPMKEKKLQKVPSDTPNLKPQVYDELLVAGADGVPRLYKMHREVKREIGDDANKIKEFSAMAGRTSAVKFDNNGDRFAAVSSLDGKGAVRVYSVADNKVIDCQAVTGAAYAVSWSPDGKTLASAGFDGIVWIHDASSGKLLRKFNAAPLQD